MTNLKSSIYAAIDQIANAEKITKVALAGISRDMLIYVPDSQDIEAVNRLIGVLSPMNKRVAILYFNSFLPWEQEKDKQGNHVRFGKRIKSDKRVKRAMDKITDWLKSEENTIWTWGDKNIEIKQKDLAGMLRKAIQKALDGDEKSDTPPLTMAEVTATFISAGVDVDTLLEAMDNQEVEEEFVPDF